MDMSPTVRYTVSMNSKNGVTPAQIQALEKQNAKNGLTGAGHTAEKLAEQVDWKPVPGVECVEVHRGGALRLSRRLEAKDGVVDVQIDGRRLRAAPTTLHRAAWPEMWPALAGPPPAVELGPVPSAQPKRPFKGLERAPAGPFETPAWPEAPVAPPKLNFKELAKAKPLPPEMRQVESEDEDPTAWLSDERIERELAKHRKPLL